MFRKSLIITLAFATTGCMSQSQIQGKYVAQQDDCREYIAGRMANVQGGAGSSAASTTVATQFSECMNKAGWHVSMPKTGQVATGPAPNPPTGSPSTNPSAASVAAPAQTATAPKPVTNPPSGSPSVNPSAAAARAPAPAAKPTINTPSAPLPASKPATYQPARPIATTSAPSYGTGAGRQF